MSQLPKVSVSFFKKEQNSVHCCLAHDSVEITRDVSDVDRWMNEWMNECSGLSANCNAIHNDGMDERKSSLFLVLRTYLYFFYSESSSFTLLEMKHHWYCVLYLNVRGLESWPSDQEHIGCSSRCNRINLKHPLNSDTCDVETDIQAEH